MKADIIIIGGGAAGMMAAVSAASTGVEVCLIEKNRKLGRKLNITGKGRCNLTNDCDVENLITAVKANSKFLYTAFYTFDSHAVMAFFEELGLPVKTERGGRVFPVSDSAEDVTAALCIKMKQAGVKIVYENVSEILISDNNVTGIRLSNNSTISCDSVILATGGKSYPATGSTGDGYKMSDKLGHTIIDISPALVPLVTREKWVTDLQGLSLKNAVIKLYDNKGECVYNDFGEMLFTHFGVSGPLMLSASIYADKVSPQNTYKLTIDLKPALDIKTLEARLIRDFEKNINKAYKNSLNKLLPQKMIPVFIELTGIDADKKINQLTKQERAKIIKTFKCIEITVIGKRSLKEAIITKGGINTTEIDPHTMESKIVKGLYFAGEIIDVHAVTGGYNLQIAWSTGYLAGINAYQG